MTSKLVDVLAKILEGLSNNSSIEDISKTLVNNKHYDKKLLSAAFSLVYDKILFKQNHKELVTNKKESSIRFLSEEEKDFLGLDNYNYLLHLMNVGLIDASNLEAILSQISLFPEMKVTRREINWIILLALVEYDNELLPGSRYLIYSSDTIN